MGRCRTVLVFGDASEPLAVLTTVSAQQMDADGPRLRAAGPVSLSQRALDHIQCTVLGLADSVLGALGIPTGGAYELSFANVGLASSNDVGLSIDGFSADVPVLLATLSTALDLPVRQDVVCTAHVASKDGDLAVVASLPAKAQAAAADTTVRTFLYADPRRESSLSALAPDELTAVDRAISWACQSLRPVPVRRAAELIEYCFSPFHVVTASLRKGYFRCAGTEADTASGAKQVAGVLSVGSEGAFWDVLEREVLAGDASRFSGLLGAWVDCHTRRGKYPSRLGQRLRQLLLSLPPGTARRGLTFPIVPIDRCLALARCAGGPDQEDIPRLVHAVSERPRWPSAVSLRRGTLAKEDTADRAERILRDVLSEISPSTIAEKVTGPIDAARLAYSSDTPNVASHDEFLYAVWAYYLHLLRHTCQVCEPAEPTDVAGKALELLDHAFMGDRSHEQAYARARHGTEGGLLSVLDAMTDRFRYESSQNHVRRVFKEAMDPFDTETRAAVMERFLAYLGPHLPPEIAAQPPEQYAANYDRIIQTYLESTEKVNALLRSM